MKRELVPTERTVQSIRWIRGEKVLLDSDLAALYGVLTKVLNQAVKRNHERFSFVKLDEALKTNRELAQKFAELEQRVGKHDEEIAAIVEAIRQLITAPEKPRREIGFHVCEKSARYRNGDGR
jgi:septal ring factor EnvC (AmiA/AmiB activator)